VTRAEKDGTRRRNDPKWEKRSVASLHKTHISPAASFDKGCKQQAQETVRRPGRTV
jgi:hypothetical protein